jgi:DNA polymerase-1
VVLSALLQTLSARGATLRADGERLGVSPVGAVAGLEDALRRHKPALLELLARSGGALNPEELGLSAGLAKDHGLQPLLLEIDRHLPRAEAGCSARAVLEKEGKQYPQTPQGYTLITESHDLEALLPHLEAAPVLGLDLETTGLDPHRDRVRLLSLALPDGRAYLVDLFRVDPRALGRLFGVEGPVLVGHNLKFDLGFLTRLGLALPTGARLHDTALCEQLLRAEGRMPALSDLAREYLGLTLDKRHQTSDWSGPLSESQLAYAAADASVVLRLRAVQLPRLEAAGLAGVTEIEHRALPALAWMGLSGVPFDPGRWLEVAKEEEAQAKAALQKLDWRTNWDSPKQVLTALRRAGLKLDSTREEALAAHRDHPAVSALLDFREHRKKLNTYGASWLEHLHPLTGRIHPSWKQIGAASGRMACSRPNLQQVPREPAYRSCFRAPEGRALVKADYSQIELRLAALIAGERRMIEAFERGEDLHALTAKLVTGKAEPSRADRQLAKALNFGLVYGMGSERLRVYASSGYGVRLTSSEAANLRERFFAAYPGLRRWHRSQPEGDAEVRTLTGRRRHTAQLTEKLNTPVQGSGADGLKLALALLYERRHRHREALPVLAVHDEVVLEAPLECVHEVRAHLEATLLEGMGAVTGGRVAVAVEAGVYRDWGVTDLG